MPSDRSMCTIHVPGMQYSGVNAINQEVRMFDGITSRDMAGYNPETQETSEQPFVGQISFPNFDRLRD